MHFSVATMSTASLVIPKSTVSVDVRDTTGATASGELYVTTLEGARENLQGLLTSRAFVPLRRPDGSVAMLGTRALVWIRLDLLTALDEIDAEAEAAETSKTARLSVALEDGSSIEGSVRYLRPTGRERLSDYFESIGAYFTLRTEDHVYLVRRDHVVAVTPLAEERGA